MTPFNIYKRWPFNPYAGLQYFMDVPGIALPQLAACIPNYECEILDGFMSEMKINNFKEKIKSFDVVGISIASSYTALNAELTIKIIKKVDLRIKIIIGGHHATAFHLEWIKRGVDVIVRREGELTFAELIEGIEKQRDFKTIEGITYNDNGEAKVNPDRPFIKNLDDLPLPRWDLMDLNKYDFFPPREGLVASLETSRGCPHQCSYCLASAMWKHTQRYKSVDRILQELQLLKELNITKMIIIDDNLGEKYERDMELFRRMVNENIDIVWGAFIRPDNAFLYPGMIELAGKAGCKFAMVGFETLDIDRLDKYEKKYAGNVSPKSYVNIYNIFKRNNIFVCGMFLVGDMDEDKNKENSVMRVMCNLKERICDLVWFDSIRPLPLTMLYKEAVERNALAKDMFYHERFATAFKGTKLMLNLALFYNFHLWQLIKIFNKHNLVRAYYRRYYSRVFRNVLNINYNSFKEIIRYIVQHKKLSSQEWQEWVVNKYLNKLKNAI